MFSKDVLPGAGDNFHFMNYLDIIFAIPLLWAVYRGFTKGFVRMFLALAALLLGIWGSIHFGGLLAPYVDRFFHPDPKYLGLLSFSLCFLLIVFVIHLAAWIIDRMVKAVALGFVNRLAGVAFSLLKMAFILSVLLNLTDRADKKIRIIPEEDREASILYDPLLKIAPLIYPYLRFEEIRELLDLPEEQQPEKEI